MNFLLYKFNRGASYGSLNTDRSAIALIIDQNISNDPIIKRFFKGIFRLRPSKPKYDKIWNIDPVLDSFSNFYPLETLNIKQLTEKLIILLALATAHRVQTLSLININNIVCLPSGVEIKISELIKTSAPGRYQPLLVLPFLVDKPQLCVAKTLMFYLTFTKDLRNTQKLFIALNKPHGEVSAQTLARWIKMILKRCGLNNFTAHSTRHAATSTAYKNGVGLDAIKRTAGWSKNSQIFFKFYNRPVEQVDNLTLAVLNPERLK